MNLHNVRKLELMYAGSTLGKADLVVEYIGGRIKVFEVDRFLIEKLLDKLEDREVWRLSGQALRIRLSRTELLRT